MLEGSGREETPLPFALSLLAWAERRLDGLERRIRLASKRQRGEPIEARVEVDWRLGDEVMALPAFQALKQQRGFLVHAWVRHPELLVLNPFVDSVNRLALRPDLIVDLKRDAPMTARRRTIERAARVDLAGIVPRVYLSHAERHEPALPELVGLGRPWVAVIPGSSQPCKTWDADRWRVVARGLADDGASVLELGEAGPSLGIGRSLVGRTPGVRTLARVLAQADLAVGVDAGPLHLALAVGTRAIGLFGPTDPELLYPPGDGMVALESAGGCRRCWPARRLAYPSGVCPLARHECMEGVEVSPVLRASRRALEGGRIRT